jgi:hypothetical protein
MDFNESPRKQTGRTVLLYPLGYRHQSLDLHHHRGLPPTASGRHDGSGGTATGSHRKSLSDGSKVVPPSNRPTPLREEVAIYVEHGIETWVVEPKKQEVRVPRRGEPLISASLRLQSVLQWNGKAVPLSAIFQLS